MAHPVSYHTWACVKTAQVFYQYVSVIIQNSKRFKDTSDVFWTSDDSVGLTWDIAERVIEHLKR